MENADSINFTVRDGENLSGIKVGYPSTYLLQNPILVFLHGGSFNSRRYISFAQELCKTLPLTVLLLDMRGHGNSGGPRGDTDYIGQLEDDLADVLTNLRQTSPSSPVVIGGHSSGAIVILRYLQKYDVQGIVGHFFIAPPIPAVELARFHRKNHFLLYRINYYRKLPHYSPMPSYAEKQVPVIRMLTAIIAKLIPFLRRRLQIVTFPGHSKTAALENRVLQYTYNMMASCNINSYQDALKAIKKPSLFLIGDKDELIRASSLKTALIWHVSRFTFLQFEEIENSNHLNICKNSVYSISSWIKKIIKINEKNGGIVACQ